MKTATKTSSNIHPFSNTFHGLKEGLSETVFSLPLQMIPLNYLLLTAEPNTKLACFGASRAWVYSWLSVGTYQVRAGSTKPHESRVHATTTKNVNYGTWRSPFRLPLWCKYLGLYVVGPSKRGLIYYDFWRNRELNFFFFFFFWKFNTIFYQFIILSFWINYLIFKQSIWKFRLFNIWWPEYNILLIWAKNFIYFTNLTAILILYLLLIFLFILLTRC